MSNQPYTRNWGKECLEIAKGNTKIKPKKEHVIHLVRCFTDLMKKVEEMNRLTAIREAQLGRPGNR